VHHAASEAEYQDYLTAQQRHPQTPLPSATERR
jgi:hypothetical protein